MWKLSMASTLDIWVLTLSNSILSKMNSIQRNFSITCWSRVPLHQHLVLSKNLLLSYLVIGLKKELSKWQTKMPWSFPNLYLVALLRILWEIKALKRVKMVRRKQVTLLPSSHNYNNNLRTSTKYSNSSRTQCQRFSSNQENLWTP